ncbi:hypothetical protein BGW37DRAFT_537962 [Umbelopsis sp. PMI_123]|nr:hypothetical protein BGW37DRAFT_537962 [Umbelopsis sp. PMI_123]
MPIFKRLFVTVAAISVHITTIRACITAETDLDGRSAPTANATRTANVYLTGDCIDVKCQAIGDTLYGSNVWDYDGTYYFSDYYVKTGYSGLDPNIPVCNISTSRGTGADIVAKAQTQNGIVYSWGGGDNNGPTDGICCSPSGYNDTNVIGYDCSGLTKYALFQAKGISLAHYTCDQFNDTRGQKLPFNSIDIGDFIFYGTDADQCNEHVAIFAGNGTMVEAREHGVPVGTHPVRTGHSTYVVRF